MTNFFNIGNDIDSAYDDQNMVVMFFKDDVPGRRTKISHPYNYDPFTTFKNNIKPNDSAYSDRLYTWNPTKYNDLCMKHFGDVGQYWSSRSTTKIQEFLCDYYDSSSLTLCEIQEQCNQATGYPVWFFSFFKTDELVSDEEIAFVFKNTNFGRTDYRQLLALSVLKKALKYHCGHTITQIMIKMDLTKEDGSVTEKGRRFCYKEMSLSSAG
jgi:hypothetical protein